MNPHPQMMYEYEFNAWPGMNAYAYTRTMLRMQKLKTRTERSEINGFSSFNSYLSSETEYCILLRGMVSYKLLPVLTVLTPSLILIQECQNYVATQCHPAPQLNHAT